MFIVVLRLADDTGQTFPLVSLMAVEGQRRKRRPEAGTAWQRCHLTPLLLLETAFYRALNTHLHQK